MNIVTLSVIILGGVGLTFSVLLAFLGNKLKVEEDPRVARLLDVLPGINCGACGFSGCRAYAEAAVEQARTFSGCLPGGAEVNQQRAEILELGEYIPVDRKVAVCRCGADEAEKKASAVYQGPLTCQSAHVIGGLIDCSFGCLGLGDCVSVCPAGGLAVKNKKVVVDIEKCIGCGRCVQACPRNLFELVPVAKATGTYYVACNAREKGANVRKVCSRGCISCGICVKVDNSPFHLKDDLSYIDYKKAQENGPLEEAAKKCPTKCILVTGDGSQPPIPKASKEL
jgi:RnfABCDGE-type electron transport complex B subunit